MNKIAEYCFKKMYPNENFQRLGAGVRSIAFRSERGKIIRIKPLWSGTYDKEEKILNFIKKNGGIDCNIPDIKAFVSMPYAFSEHLDFGGKIATITDFETLDAETQKSFARQLATSLISLHKMGMKPGAKKIFNQKTYKTRIKNFFRQIQFILFFMDNKKRLNLWMSLCRSALKVFQRKKPLQGLAHDDLHFSNVIEDDKYNLLGLIDFGEIRYLPVEYNLRKFPKYLRDWVVKYWTEDGYETDLALLNYYRAKYLLTRLVKRKHKQPRENLEQELYQVVVEQI